MTMYPEPTQRQITIRQLKAENEAQRKYVQTLADICNEREAENERLREALEDSRRAIGGLSPGALGSGHNQGELYSLRDELLDKINKALEPTP